MACVLLDSGVGSKVPRQIPPLRIRRDAKCKRAFGLPGRETVGTGIDDSMARRLDRLREDQAGSLGSWNWLKVDGLTATSEIDFQDQHGNEVYLRFFT
jgi:hypothetical protein